MTAPYLGSSSPYSRQVLRGQAHCQLTRDLYVPRPAEGTAPMRVRDLPLSERVAAALLVVPDGILCLETAALWLKIDAVDDDGCVHLGRSRGRSRCVREDVMVHRYAIRDDEVFAVRDVQVTHGPRLLTDLAAGCTLERLVAVGDVVLKRYDESELHEALNRARRRPGVELLRQAVPLMDSGSDSAAETRARLRLQAAGFTSLRHGVTIKDGAGQWLASPDLGDEVAKVAVQHEGKVHFEKGEKQRIHDVDRDELSRTEGWQVVISTRKDDANPLLLVTKVTRAYLDAAVRWGRHVLPPHLR